MRRGVVVLAAVGALTACGGKSEPLAKTARPCLAKLGTYIHHAPTPPTTGTDRTPRLPVLDPDWRPSAQEVTPQRLAWPEDFQEYGEISFPPTMPGANAVQVLIFGDENLPKRVKAANDRARHEGTFFQTFGQVTRVGQTLVLWSSVPTASQRRHVLACVERS